MVLTRRTSLNGQMDRISQCKDELLVEREKAKLEISRQRSCYRPDATTIHLWSNGAEFLRSDKALAD